MDGARVIDPAYRHFSKRSVPGAPVQVGDVFLKWYDLAPAADPIASAVTALARSHVAARLAIGPVSAGDCGFAILHRCGVQFYFLLMSVWRGNNELWEAVHYRDGTMPDFDRFDAAYPAEGLPRPTFCVWELDIVAHEAASWARLLRSDRGEDDMKRWRDDRFAGDV